MNTIQLNLLETKQVAAYVNGYSYALEGGYRIVAGEQGATEFQITSVPQQYSGAKFTIQLINARKQLVKEVLEVPLNGKFTLPVGMAVAGYGQMLIRCDITHSSPTYEINVEKVIWTPLKLKIWNTRPDWKSDTITLTDEILDRLNQAEDDVRALEELVKNIEINPQGGGTTMLTEGREFGKELKDNDYWLDVIGLNDTIQGYSQMRGFVPVHVPMSMGETADVKAGALTYLTPIEPKGEGLTYSDSFEGGRLTCTDEKSFQNCGALTYTKNN